MKLLMQPWHSVDESAQRSPFFRGITSNSWTSFAALPIFSLALVTSGMTHQAEAQQPQFPHGMVSPGQGNAPDPAEASAYSAAIAEPNVNLRISAIQQFLVNHPESTLRQPAIAQLLMAKRQSKGGGAAPVPGPPMDSPGNTVMPPARSASAPTPIPSASPDTGATTPRDSLLQKAPQHAEITLAPHSLAIRANNSTLSQILHDISNSTGMKIDGLSKDERVFGTYGPGDDREVLLSLLEGSGYNVVMIGDLAGGAPRELSLTQRGASIAAGSSQAPAAPAEDDADDAEQDVQQAMPPPPDPPIRAQGTESGQPHSPQEILEQLQQLRQQQNQSPPQQ